MITGGTDHGATGVGPSPRLAAAVGLDIEDLVGVDRLALLNHRLCYVYLPKNHPNAGEHKTGADK